MQFKTVIASFIASAALANAGVINAGVISPPIVTDVKIPTVDQLTHAQQTLMCLSMVNKFTHTKDIDMVGKEVGVACLRCYKVMLNNCIEGLGDMDKDAEDKNLLKCVVRPEKLPRCIADHSESNYSGSESK